MLLAPSNLILLVILVLLLILMLFYNAFIVFLGLGITTTALLYIPPNQYIANKLCSCLKITQEGMHKTSLLEPSSSFYLDSLSMLQEQYGRAFDACCGQSIAKLYKQRKAWYYMDEVNFSTFFTPSFTPVAQIMHLQCYEIAKAVDADWDSLMYLTVFNQ